MLKEMKTPGEFQEMVQAFRKSRVILTGYELDVFSLIDQGHSTSEDIAKVLKTDPRATDRLLNAIVAAGLLNKKGINFSNTDFASRFLVKGNSAYMAGLAHTVNMWKTWSDLTECVRKGSTVKMDAPIETRENRWLESFIAAMHARSSQAKEVAEVLDLSETTNILDVGGGSGIFLYEFIRKNNRIKGVIFDLPPVIPITKEYISREGFEAVVSTREGNYLTDSFGSGYDMIFLSAVVHINSPEENRILVQKCADAVIPGGKLVILDHIMSEDRTEPAVGAFFALNMLVGTEKGDTYTEREIRSWMEIAGFGSIERINTSQGTSLLCGERK
jgi:SAM-dependent methyltransferase